MKAPPIAAVTIVLVAFAGCAAPVTDLTGRFQENEFRWAGEPGTAVLRGQAFVRTNAGEVKPCAGLEVYLVPETGYTRAVSVAREEGATNFAPHPPAYQKYRRATIGDAQGNFEFTALPAGTWYVGCNLYWTTNCSLWGCVYSGALLERKVTTKPGEALKVVVTPDTVPREKQDVPAKRCVTFPFWC